MVRQDRNRALLSTSSNSNQPAIVSNIEHLLKAVADCSSALLGDEDFDRGVNEALAILGRSTGADRLAIVEHHKDTTGQSLGYVVGTYEWLSCETESQLHHPELSRIPGDGMEDCYYMLVSGRYWGGLLENMPEPFRSGQEKLGVKATYAVPVMVKQKYWGFIGLDFCQTARELCEAQIAVLKTAATCIGSAIQRERNRQEKEAAERTALLQQQKAEELQKRDYEVSRRHCLLNITAKAAQALLNDVNLERAIANALQIIGEGIDTDRVSVMEHCRGDRAKSLGYLKMLFEWHSSYAVSQLKHPDLQQVSYEGVEDWYEQLKRGEAVGGIVETLPEPVRSGQLELGVKSLYSVPITIDGEYWGVIGFDDCREAKQRSETEISILKTTAACIGSAIQQNRIHQRREQAERQALLERQKATQLAEHNRVLSQRDREVQRSYRILTATAEAANILLSKEVFDEAVNKALQTMGQTMDVDRALVIEHCHNPSKPSIPNWRILYEWHSIYVTSQLRQPELSQGSYAGIEEWYKILSTGKSISYRLEEIPEPFRSIKAKIGVKILHVVPIFIERKYWGVIAINDCRELKYRSEAELSIFKTAAACIGGAIQQERIRRAKEEAERKILKEREQAAVEKAAQLVQSNRVLSVRDRWLEATANAANKLLEIADHDEGINAALKVLGESLECDRIGIMQYFKDITDEPSEFVCQHFEWNSAGTISQINHPQLHKISNLGMEESFAKLQTGEWIGGLIEEFLEPFRSGQIELGVRSTYAVPIFVNNQFWGILGIDRGREAKRLTLPEIAVFKTVASCIASAIYRQQIQQEKEQAELAVLQERNRMAREIHDTLAQAFTGISLQLEAAKSNLTTESEAVRERLLNAKRLAKEGIAEARRSVRALRPQALESVNLTTALQQLVAKMVSGMDLEANIFVEGEPHALTSEIEVELYRIAQEALTNTLRYAQASQVDIQLIYEADTVHLQIKDNGIGFDLQSLQNEGFGLLGMRERSDRLDGNLIINSAIGQGTEIIVTVVAE